MPPTTILITGAAGFIGSHLTDQMLAEGHKVIGIDNFNDFYSPADKHRNLAEAIQQANFTLIEADIRDAAAMQSAFAQYHPSIVVHLAAMAGVRPSIERPAYYTEVNVQGTVNLLDAAVAAGIAPGGLPKFIFASSSSVYGNNPKTPFAETDNVDHPISPYAATKKAGELICHAYHHLHKLPVTCLRFFTVFGPRQRPDLAISKFLRLISAGQPIPVFGDGSTSRDYTFVGDIVTGIRAAMDCCGERGERAKGQGPSGGNIPGAGLLPGVPGGYRIYNLGGNHPTSLSQLIAAVEQVVGKKALIERQPMQPGDVERTWADLTRAQAELGYQPGTTIVEGIARQWDWMRSQC